MPLDLKTSKEELGIISEVEYGCRNGQVGLYFIVQLKIFTISEFLTPDETIILCRKHSIENINDLEGKPCIVTINMDLVSRKSMFKELFNY